MPNNVDGGGSGGSDNESFAARFLTITEDGKSFDIRWLALFSAGVSGVVIAWYQALIGFFESLSVASTTVFRAVQRWTVQVLEALFQAAGVMDSAWAAATVQVADSGLLAFPLAVAIGGAAWAVVSLGVTLIAE